MGKIPLHTFLSSDCIVYEYTATCYQLYALEDPHLINHRDSDLLPKAIYMFELKIVQKQLCKVSKSPQPFFKHYHPQYPQRELYSLELNLNPQ